MPPSRRLACHSTDGRPELDAPFGTKPASSLTAGTRAAEFGVACEMCHGPGAVHADANRNPLRRYRLHFQTGASDDTIVQPAHLDPRRASEVCGQCHAFWEFPDSQSERDANSRGLPYRPGQDLAATRFIVQPTKNLDSPALKALLAADAGFVRDVFWSDGMVRATGREYNGLLDSPCFKNAGADARRTMTCFSCHVMHKPAGDRRSMREWANGQLAATATGNEACTTCHATTREHSHHRADSAGSSCVECHMIRTKPDRGLRKISDETGGGYFELKKSADLPSTFTRVAQELHSQYALGFEAKQLDGKVHKLAVRMVTNDGRAVAALRWRDARGGA